MSLDRFCHPRFVSRPPVIAIKIKRTHSEPTFVSRSGSGYRDVPQHQTVDDPKSDNNEVRIQNESVLVHVPRIADRCHLSNWQCSRQVRVVYEVGTANSLSVYLAPQVPEVVDLATQEASIRVGKDSNL